MNDDTPQPTAHPALQPVRGAAGTAITGLILVGAAWVVRAVWQVRLATTGQPSSGPPDQGNGRHRPLTGLEDAYHIITTLGDVATLLCAIAFLAWLLRVRDNARVLSGQPPRYSGPWVYLGWIVPVMNLWVPRGIVADVHQQSAPGERLPRAVNWWWGLWLAGMLSGLGLMYTNSTTDDVIARAYTDVRLLLVADAAVVGAAVAGVLVIRALTAVQQRPRPC
ncbi:MULTISPECIES: DUF4328 domain-containing protein [Streptomyces]|uniref:DUF4328 domain-containing protein n=2 Tax=Streptomyces rimosus subsp. rimosus TaxID=132474 RepID=L8ENZ2_STRR1|nr:MULTISPECIES: DUF4328 domain-containing protein [Streptomyces]KOG84114.1 hypothetical protein ADK78_00460 [Kitasatospora aureofaciens]MYT46407.1 DUF4328 domain-containing protein [Streptomyces sp. SID5471]KEF07554.1 hypothetical protein DF17_08355 [Streptomyces rimosus]KEF20417.1 hypothetical protein DF18_12320 [Streptomyces rimosus]KUJ43394.1 hypothetical protein ADK46_00450 [Streptomyces rimosus subsp. rimosus]